MVYLKLQSLYNTIVKYNIYLYHHYVHGQGFRTFVHGPQTPKAPDFCTLTVGMCHKLYKLK